MGSDAWWLTNEPLYPGGKDTDCSVYSGAQSSWYITCDQHEVPVGACAHCAWSVHFCGRDEFLPEIEWVRLHPKAKWHVLTNGRPYDKHGKNVLLKYMLKYPEGWVHAD